MTWLYVILAIFLAFCLRAWTVIRKARQCGRLLVAASEAEQRGDIPGAVCTLREAECRATGRLAAIVRTAAKESLARLLFKSGQLDESAAVTFDLLEQLRGSP